MRFPYFFFCFNFAKSALNFLKIYFCILQLNASVLNYLAKFRVRVIFDFKASTFLSVLYLVLLSLLIGFNFLNILHFFLVYSLFFSFKQEFQRYERYFAFSFFVRSFIWFCFHVSSLSSNFDNLLGFFLRLMKVFPAKFLIWRDSIFAVRTTIIFLIFVLGLILLQLNWNQVSLICVFHYLDLGKYF